MPGIRLKAQKRDSDWVHRDPLPDHPGELEDPAVPVAPLAIDYVGSSLRPWHHHKRGQLVYAISGTMEVATGAGAWVVAPEQAVWVPPRMDHQVGHRAGVAMRTLYIDAESASTMPADCCVVAMTPLLRELLLRAMDIGLDYTHNVAHSRLMQVLMDELAALEPEPMHLPIPSDQRLARITHLLRRSPGDHRTLGDWAGEAGASERTLVRLFQSETGMTFSAWRERLRLMSAIPRLVNGDSVTAVALDLGYRSPSAFIAMFRRNTGATPAQYVRRQNTAS